MSGVAGADRVRSRQDFDHFIQDYKRLISLFPGFVSLQPSGSYNSNPDKQDFGDIDLIVHISSNLSKADVKKQLQAFFMKEPETKIVPFSSEKHAGKRTYNAGELVSVRYHDDALGYSAQIDNIIALDHNEAGFKQQFLDWPAEKQGLILGLVKVATIETDPSKIFRSLGIQANTNIEANQEYEFNLSSVRIELRLSTYDPELLKQGTYKTIKSEVVWQSQNFDDLKKILWQYDLDDDFAGLVAQAKQTVKNPRSPQRIKGVFASMITVKSGEVGTAKGAGKEAALAKINQTFSETRSLFRALVEADDQRRVVFAFVRFQPPTVGHELLITTVKETAEANHCPYAIYVSRTQDHKKNPLSIEQKMQYLNKLFPGTNFVAAGATTRTPIEAAKALNGKFNDLILVAGSDRANLRDTLEAYNHKEYDYNTIDFVSAGERDPDADDVAGISGTNVRQMALDGDYESFKSNLPGSADDATAEQLMRDIQAGMTKPARARKTGENNDRGGSYAAVKPGYSGEAQYTSSRADQGFNIGENMKLKHIYEMRGKPPSGAPIPASIIMPPYRIDFDPATRIATVTARGTLVTQHRVTRQVTGDTYRNYMQRVIDQVEMDKFPDDADERDVALPIRGPSGMRESNFAGRQLNINIPEKVSISGYTVQYDKNTKEVTVSNNGRLIDKFLYTGGPTFGQFRTALDHKLELYTKSGPTPKRISSYDQTFPQDSEYGVSLPQDVQNKIYQQHDQDTQDYGNVDVANFGKWAAIRKRRAKEKTDVAEGLVIPDALIQGLARKFPQYKDNITQLEMMAAEILKKNANPQLYKTQSQRIDGVRVPKKPPVKSPYDTDVDEKKQVPIGEELESIMAGLISIIESKHGRT